MLTEGATLGRVAADASAVESLLLTVGPLSSELGTHKTVKALAFRQKFLNHLSRCLVARADVSARGRVAADATAVERLRSLSSHEDVNTARSVFFYLSNCCNLKKWHTYCLAPEPHTIQPKPHCSLE